MSATIAPSASARMKRIGSCSRRDTRRRFDPERTPTTARSRHALLKGRYTAHTGLIIETVRAATSQLPMCAPVTRSPRSGVRRSVSASGVSWNRTYRCHRWGVSRPRSTTLSATIRTKARNDARARRSAARSSAQMLARRMLSTATRRRPRHAWNTMRAATSADPAKAAAPVRAAQRFDTPPPVGTDVGAATPGSGGELAFQVVNEVVDTLERDQIGDLDGHLEPLLHVVHEVEHRQRIEPEPIEAAV